MNYYFINGQSAFPDPAWQFNEPRLKLKNMVLTIGNKDLLPIAENRSPIEILIEDIAIQDAPVYDDRLEEADLSYPIWVATDIRNINDKKYYLIDGKHRLHLLKENSVQSVQAIVFSVKEIRSVLQPIPSGILNRLNFYCK